MLKTEEGRVGLQLHGLVLPAASTRARLRLTICGLIFMSYAVAFVLPAYEYSGPMRGYEAFLSGLFFQAGSGVLSWIAFTVSSGWLANSIFWAGTLLLLRGRTAGASISAVAALLLAVRSGLFADSSQVPLLLGYYVWLFSIGGLAVASPLFWRLRRF